MVMRTSLAALCFLAATVCASTESDESQLDRIQSEMYSILNKAGIDFSGKFRSQYLSSSLDDGSGDSAVNWGNNRSESNEFTSVDFDIKARPNEALAGRLIFRMHQNWQNFWSDVANPIFTRWISIDANIENMFRFNVGDFRQRYSQLTLWSPDIEIAYEPEIFAAKRREAQNEVFLGNNDRLLQGINFNFDAEVVPVLNELHFNCMLSRLRLNGANIKNGSAVADNFENALMDRYLVGTNIDVLALKGLGAGGSVLKVFDYTPTYNGPVKEGDLIARSGLIAAFRLQPNTSIFMDSDVFCAGLDFEIASSTNRDSAWFHKDTTTINTVMNIDTTVETRNCSGMAMNIDVKGHVNIGDAAKIKFSLGIMSNDYSYLNEMAQTPSFLGQRIMNVENDENSGMLYTTFDALYNHVFKFSPNSTNYWTKNPRRKISYVTTLLTRTEIDTTMAKGKSYYQLDPALQTVLPYGPATPNRTGPKGKLNFDLLEGGVNAGVEFAMLSEDTIEFGTEKAKFTMMGGGLCVDFATWAKPLNTCKVNLGYSMQNAKRGSVKYNNNFLNAGLYYNFWQRFSALAGFQQIVGEYAANIKNTQTQSQWAIGLEYKVSETSKLIGRFGNMAVKNKSTAAVTKPEDDPSLRDFSATLAEVYMNVDF